MLLEQLSEQVDRMVHQRAKSKREEKQRKGGYEQPSGFYDNEGGNRDLGDSFINVMRQQADQSLAYRSDKIGHILNS